MVVVKRILVVVVGDVGGLARALRQDLVVAGLVLLDGKDLSLVPLFDIWVNGDDLGDGLLDRIEVWGIGRQKDEDCAGILNGLPSAGDLVGG